MGCLLFVLFTTQRSGSSWVCEVLRAQEGTHCGVLRPGRPPLDEPLISFSYDNAAKRPIQWTEWAGNLTRVFDQVVAQSGCTESRTLQAVGFKLMYDQTPPDDVPSFLQHLAKRSIHVVHLVREAAVMRAASKAQTAQAMTRLNLSSYEAHHTSNPAVAQAIRAASTRIAFGTHAIVNDVVKADAQDSAWRVRLLFEPGVRYHPLLYEHLLGRLRDDAMRDALHFLGQPVRGSPFARGNGTTLQLHKPRCGERIKHFAEVLEALRKKGTRTFHACKLLEREAGRSGDPHTLRPARDEAGDDRRRPATATRDARAAAGPPGPRRRASGGGAVFDTDDDDEDIISRTTAGAGADSSVAVGELQWHLRSRARGRDRSHRGHPRVVSH